MAGRVLLWIAPVVLLSALAAIIMYVRLLQGPVSLKFMAGPIERGISAELSGLTAKVDDALIQRTEAGGFEFQLVNMRLFEADGSVVASTPVAAVSLDLSRLLSLEVLPKSVDLIEPRISVTYSQRNGLSLSFAESGPAQSVAPPPDGKQDAGATAPPAAAPSGSAGNGAAGPLRQFDLARVIAEYSARARRQQGATGTLTEAGLRNATVDIDFEGRRSRWKLAELSVDLDHRRSRSIISAAAVVESDRGPWSMTLLTEDSEKTGNVVLKAAVRDLVPSSLGRAFPSLALLRALEMPTAGNAAIRLKTSGEVLGADVAVEIGRGLVDFGPAMAAPMLVDAGLFTLNFDSATERLTISPSTVRWGDSSVNLAGEVVHQEPTDGAATWAFDIRSLSGSLASEEFKVAPVPLDAFSVKGQYAPGENRIDLNSVEVKAGGGSAVFAGDIRIGDDPQAGARIDGQFGPASADVVKAVWPRMIAPRARQWVGEHLTEGLLETGKISFASGGYARPGAPLARAGVPESVTLDLKGQAVRISPVKNGPPLAVPAMTVSVRDRVLEILAADAVLETTSGGVPLKQSRFYVADIDAAIAEAELSFKAMSPLQPVVAAARQLQLIATDGFVLSPDKIQGKFDGDLAIRLPLLPEIEAQTVVVTGKAKVMDIKSKEKIGAITVQSGAVDVTLGELEATAKGELILNGVLAKLDWRRQMPPGADPVTSPLTLSANLDNSDRRQLGIDAGEFVDGDVPVAIAFGKDAAGGSTVRVVADLTPADFSIPPVAFKKPRGRPGKIEFDVVDGKVHKTELRNFRITGDDIAAEGWIGLSADQEVQEFEFPGVSLNTVSRLDVKGKRGQRDILDVTAKGSTFDGRDFFRSLFTSTARPKPAGAREKGGVDVTASIDTVLGYSDTNLSKFAMKLSKRGGELTALDARGTFEGGKALVAILQTETNGKRKIIADTTDAGRSLKLVGFYPNMQGGRGRIDVFLDGPDQQQTAGILIIEDFKVLGDPIVSEVVSSASGDGPAIGSATYGQRRVVREVFEFDRMRLPFSVGYGQFAIDDSYLRGPLLGATLRGKVDYSTQKVNLGGTYIPLQGLNNALGGIPVLGQILSGPRGEGIFGITFAVQGAMSNPQVVVNPLSLVAPGIFREMFQMTNPSTNVQPRAPSPANVPVEKRVRASSSGGAAEAPATIDGWSSDTVVPSKKK